MPSDGGAWITIFTGRRTIYPKRLGEYYDTCEYINKNNIKYVYYGSINSNNQDFDIQASDFESGSDINYSGFGVTIISPNCH